MTRQDIIERMVQDYRKELEALRPQELADQWETMGHLKAMSPEAWAALKQANDEEKACPPKNSKP